MLRCVDVGILSRFFAPTTWGVRRRAIAAEAAGDYLTAAGLYAEAGDRQKVLEMHLCHAEDAPSRPERAERLRRALRWVDDAEDRRRVQGELGRVLARMADDAAPSPGLPDRALLSEAAQMLVEAGAWDEAGRAFERLGDDDRAAEAFGQAGEVDRMEAAYGRAERLSSKKRTERDAFDDYQLRLSEGDRRGALAALETCLAASETAGNYLGLRDKLAAALSRRGRVTLGLAGERVTVAGGPLLLLGRDPDGALPLHDVGISRQHAEIALVTPQDGDGARLTFTVRDLGSRNGTLLGGVALGGVVELPDEGELALGDRCRLGFRIVAQPALSQPRLEVTVMRGLDRGRRLFFGPRVALDGGLIVEFADGQPLLRGPGTLVLNGFRTARPIQLIAGDVVEGGGRRVEVVG
jgi:tetratricopeptide (TPR) repeat protein